MSGNLTLRSNRHEIRKPLDALLWVLSTIDGHPPFTQVWKTKNHERRGRTRPDPACGLVCHRVVDPLTPSYN